LELIDVEVDVALGHVESFIADESSADISVEILAVVHRYRS
jgi:hypothetical protein